jgi:hypothetical protein
MQPSLRKSYSWFLIGFGLVNTLSLTLVLMSLTFITGYGLAFWHFPLSLLLALSINFAASLYFFQEGSRQVFWSTTIRILVIVVLSLGLAQLFYDISFDGQMYHMEAAYQYKHGWNPFHHLLRENFKEGIWLNHYGKGTEAPQGAVYAMTNRIDSSKGTNFMLIAASFCFCMSFLIRLNRFRLRKSAFIALLFACCPVCIYQMLTTYVDGQVSSLLLCFLAIGCLLYWESNRYFLLLLASILVILINIKFTSVVFAAIFSAGLLAALLIDRNIKTFKSVFLTCALSGIFAFAVVGYFPYIRNIVEFHDPLYPGMAMLKSEAAKNSPDRFQQMSGPAKLFTSLFTHTSNLHLYIDKNPRVPLKIPFTFNKLDIFNACKPYVVIMAGMGPFFSGLLVVSLLFYLVLARRLKNRRLFMLLTVVLITLWASIFIISEGWWMRYIPQIWFVPLIIVLATELVDIGWVRKLRNVCYVLFFVNLSFSFASVPYTLYATAKINYQLEQLKASGETIAVDFDYYAADRIRFYEKGIPVRIVNLYDERDQFMFCSPAKMIRPEHLPEVPKPLILRLADGLREKIKK